MKPRNAVTTIVSVHRIARASGGEVSGVGWLAISVLHEPIQLGDREEKHNY
jgi:hypothetical protein